jgi:hypothetical protein
MTVFSFLGLTITFLVLDGLTTTSFLDLDGLTITSFLDLDGLTTTSFLDLDGLTITFFLDLEPFSAIILVQRALPFEPITSASLFAQRGPPSEAKLFSSDWSKVQNHRELLKTAMAAYNIDKSNEMCFCVPVFCQHFHRASWTFLL